MNKREVINSIFRDYYINCKAVNYLDSLHNDRNQALRELEDNYCNNNDDNNGIYLFEEGKFDQSKLELIKRELERKIYLRNLLFELLDEDERVIVEHRFEMRKRVFQVVEDLYISEATYYRRLRNIYNKLFAYYDSFESLFNKDINN